jgi:uncharacterized membrane protein SpoIIM required for sporulation
MVVLKSFEFRRDRQKTWQELGRLVERAEKKGLRALGAQELARLPVLYRATLSSLSVARSISLDRNLVEYLESLSARAYFCVYGSKRRLRRTALDFFVRRFPAAVRRFKWQITLAAAIFLLGVLTGFVMTTRNSEWYYTFVGGMAQGRSPTSSTADLRRGLYDGDEHGAGALGTFAMFLFNHNARIGMTAFALGFLAGIPVFLLLFQTGLMLGAFVALYHGRGLGLDIIGWLMPHGVPELGAVILCGGAGLVLAQSLVFPGRSTRLRNLARQGREAGVVVLGAVAMLFVAGLIEGIFRQAVADIVVRYLVIVAGVVCFGWYFARCGRGREPRT